MFMVCYMALQTTGNQDHGNGCLAHSHYCIFVTLVLGRISSECATIHVTAPRRTTGARLGTPVPKWYRLFDITPWLPELPLLQIKVLSDPYFHLIDFSAASGVPRRLLTRIEAYGGHQSQLFQVNIKNMAESWCMILNDSPTLHQLLQ